MTFSEIMLGWSVLGPVLAILVFYDGEPNDVESWAWFFIISGPLALLYCVMLKLFFKEVLPRNEQS